MELVRKAISVTEQLCANDAVRMDRLSDLRCEVAGMIGESGVGQRRPKLPWRRTWRLKGSTIWRWSC